MKNKEKYASEIIEIACSRSTVAVLRDTGKPVDCNSNHCVNCALSGKSECSIELKKWAESEYIESPVISKADRAFLEYLKEEYKYIARDKKDALYAYNAEPCKVRESWSSGCSDDWFRLNHRFDVNFPMVKWENSKPWLIEDLKKLEVVEEYE